MKNIQFISALRECGTETRENRSQNKYICTSNSCTHIFKIANEITD